MTLLFERTHCAGGVAAAVESGVGVGPAAAVGGGGGGERCCQNGKRDELELGVERHFSERFEFGKVFFFREM